MLSPTYEITTVLSHTDELISPSYDIAIVTISYRRITMSSVWDSMMSKKNMGWPFYAAVGNRLSNRKGQEEFSINCIIRSKRAPPDVAFYAARFLIGQFTIPLISTSVSGSSHFLQLPGVNFDRITVKPFSALMDFSVEKPWVSVGQLFHFYPLRGQ